MYKEAFAHIVARNIIIEGSGTHFDPVIVEAFLAQEEEFEMIRVDCGDNALVPV